MPNGGEADVIGNVVEQTIGTRNSTIVSFGAEGYSGARNVLRFIHKAVINDESQGGTFLPVRPGADLVVSRNNLFVGIGLVDGSSVVDAPGDRSVDWRSFVRPQLHDYRLSEPSRSAWREALLAPVAIDALPRMEYVHPMGLAVLNGPPRWRCALQASAP